MATSPPDDGIPVLTDVIDAATAAALLRNGPMTRPGTSGPMSGFGPNAGPPSGFGNGTRSSPPSGFGGTAGARSGTPGPKAPPIAGPPSLSEFGGNTNPAPAPAAPAPPSLSGISPTAPAPAAPALAASGTEAAVQRAQALIVERVLARLEPMVEARLKDHLADTLEKVMAQATVELKFSTTRIVREAVTQAVADELAAQRNRARPPGQGGGQA